MKEEQKRKISNTLKGHKISKESRLKMSKAKIGKKSGMFGKKHSKETINKISKSRKGIIAWNKGLETKKHSWNYKGGTGTYRHQEMATFKYKQWRVSIFERDSYTCQVCRKVGGYLMAHHIKSWAKYPQLRLIITNGITLCEACHKLSHKTMIGEQK